MFVKIICDLLAYCTAINIVLLLCWFLAFILLHEWMYKMHSKFFKFSKETFDALHYTGLMIFKIFIVAFNLVPYIVLNIIY